MAGRKKQEKNEIALKKTAERVKALKESLNLTYEGLAAYLDNMASESTLRNYVAGRNAMNPQIAAVFHRKTGFIPYYWQGFVDEKTQREYWAAIEAAESAGYDVHCKEEAQKIAELTAFFKQLGFEYTDFSGDASSWFSAIGEEPQIAKGPHCLTRLGSPALSARFTDDELDALFSKLGGVVELECYKKMKGAKPQ